MIPALNEEEPKSETKNKQDFDKEMFLKDFVYPFVFLILAACIVLSFPGEPDKALMGAIVGVCINRARKGSMSNNNGGTK